jgi:very-short-patch-repair endonuclease
MLRRGTYACPHLDEEVRASALAGGALTCVSVLRQAGVWAGHSRQLHIQLKPGAASPASPVAVRHWEHPRFEMDSPWKAGRAQALWRALHCLDDENALAALESAIHEAYLPLPVVDRIALLAPRRLQRALGHRITNSGSGNETIVRFRLQRVGYAVEAQAYVPGMGHEDLVVEGCVGLDIDGKRWHSGDDRFAIDRDRDIHVEGLGRRALRLRTSHIFETWPHTLAVIDRAVQDARREQQRRSGRVLLTVDDPF